MKNTRGVVIGLIAIAGTAVFFLVPFAFIFVIASMDRTQTNLLQFNWPQPFVLLDNLKQVVEARDYLMIIAFINSFILTAVSVAALVIFAAMVAYIWQRRPGRLGAWVNNPGPGRLDCATGCRSHHLGAAEGWAVQNDAGADLDRDRLRAAVLHIAVSRLHVHGPPRTRRGSRGGWRKSAAGLLPSDLPGVALSDHDRDHLADGIDLQRFRAPAVFLPGTENATVQLTLFNFKSQFTTAYNLLFANILLVAIPALIMFIFFNRKIVEGMAAGSVKG